MKKHDIKPFNDNDIYQLEVLQKQNDIFNQILLKEQETNIRLIGLRGVVDKIRHEHGIMDRILTQFGHNLLRLKESDRDQLLGMYDNDIGNIQLQYDSLKAQRIHRGEELAEQRMRVLRLLFEKLVEEQGWESRELGEFLVDLQLEQHHQKTNNDEPFTEKRPLQRDYNDIQKTIQKGMKK